MDCERFDKITMELLYGELDELSETAALRHLHHCTRCREIWGRLKTTREFTNIPMEEPPADLFDSIVMAERSAQKHLTTGERFSRAISILAGYAMRPQVAMGAILLLMIGSSLMFLRSDPANRGKISVTELGTPHAESSDEFSKKTDAPVFDRVGQNSLPVEGALAQSDSAVSPSASSPAPPVDEQSSRSAYAEAMNAYQDGRYAEAERLFSEIAAGGGSQAASAALHEGHAARNGSGCGRAAALYDSIASRYSGTSVGSEASWHAASCYRALGQIRRAAAHYESLKLQSVYTSRAEQALRELEAQLNGTSEGGGNENASATPGAPGVRVASSKSKAAEAPPAPTTTAIPNANAQEGKDPLGDVPQEKGALEVQGPKVP